MRFVLKMIFLLSLITITLTMTKVNKRFVLFSRQMMGTTNPANAAPGTIRFQCYHMEEIVFTFFPLFVNSIISSIATVTSGATLESCLDEM